MLDAPTTALLRVVLDEVCKDLSRYDTGARTHVASKILEAAATGEIRSDRLKQIGRDALSKARQSGNRLAEYDVVTGVPRGRSCSGRAM